MTQKNKTPVRTAIPTGAANQKSTSDLQTNCIATVIGSLPIQYKQIMDYLAIAGNSLTTPEAAEMGIQHLPTKLSEINQAIGVYAQRERMPSKFYRYTLSPLDRQWWRDARRGEQ